MSGSLQLLTSSGAGTEFDTALGSGIPVGSIVIVVEQSQKDQEKFDVTR